MEGGYLDGVDDEAQKRRLSERMTSTSRITVASHRRYRRGCVPYQSMYAWGATSMVLTTGLRGEGQAEA